MTMESFPNVSNPLSTASSPSLARFSQKDTSFRDEESKTPEGLVVQTVLTSYRSDHFKTRPYDPSLPISTLAPARPFFVSILCGFHQCIVVLPVAAVLASGLLRAT